MASSTLVITCGAEHPDALTVRTKLSSVDAPVDEVDSMDVRRGIGITARVDGLCSYHNAKNEETNS